MSAEPMVLNFPLIVDVSEQLMTGEILASSDDPRETNVVERDVVRLSTLASESEAERGPRHLHVSVTHRRQAKGVVVARVFIVADADERLLEQLHDGSDYLSPRQTRGGQILCNLTAQHW